MAERKQRQSLFHRHYRPTLERLEDRLAPAVFTVNSLLDDTIPANGLTTLREAILAANNEVANPGQDTIDFSVAGTITLGGNLPALTSNIVILGPGAGNLTVSGANAFQPFSIGSAISVTLSGLTIADGFSAGNGGGISTAGALTLTGCVIRDHDATGIGGGIAVGGASASLTVSQSTISGNAAGNMGGGIGFLISGTASTITNSTISGNTSLGDAGGIRAASTSGFQLTLTNCTVVENRADADGAGGGAGGGILGTSGGTQVTLVNTIVAGNFRGTGSTADDLASLGFNLAGSFNNLIGAAGTSGFSPGVNGNQVGIASAGLTPLGDHGGPTPTHALLVTSPAVNTGRNAAVANPLFAGPPFTDQRGLDRIGGGVVDIGAFELQLPANLVVDSLADLNDGDYGTGQLSLREAVLLANFLTDVNIITFNLPSASALTLAGALPNLASDVTITGPGAANLTLRPNSGGFGLFTIAADVTVALAGMTLRDVAGTAVIFSDGDLTLTGIVATNNQTGGLGVITTLLGGSVSLVNCVLENNSGQGINSSGASVTLTGSTIRNNTNDAVFNAAQVNMTASTISGNGAGIESAGAVTATGSTISGNGGNGISVFGNCVLTNVTISGNSQNGIRVTDSSLTLTNVTITGNVDAGLFGEGSTPAAVARLVNTIIAGNTTADARASGFPFGDYDLVIVADSFNNLIGTGGSGGLVNGVNGNQVGVANTFLGPLADNGGPTQTHALVLGSPAIDAGLNSAIANPPFSSPPFTDQRGSGFARVVDGDASGTATVDIGAFELVPPPNTAPVLDPIGSKSVDEGSLLTFTATALDADVPVNTLRYTLIGAPAGASIGLSTGVFTWTPTEAQGPGMFTFKVRVTDNGVPNLFDEEETTVTVSEVNVAPVLGAISNKSVIEGSLLTITAAATDADLPANTLTYSLIGAPAGAGIDTSSGLFTWTPTEAQGGNAFTFTVRVSDNGAPNLFAEEQITVTVNKSNSAPVLNPIGNKTVNEGSLLTFTATATDTDIPADSLTFSLITAPAGASIGLLTGVFTWTPSEAQGPGLFTFKVRVTDNGAPNLFDEEEITVTVNEVNVAPVLDVIGAQVIDEGKELTFIATASDADLPANTLTFSLIGAPAGAAIGPHTGRFIWTPTETQGGNDFTFTVRVTDNGTGILFDEETVTITVNKVNVAPLLDQIGDQTVRVGDSLVLFVTASDADEPANTLTLSLASAPAGVGFDPDTGKLTYTPALADLGQFSVTIRVTDDGVPNLFDDETFTISVLKPLRFAVSTDAGAPAEVRVFDATTGTLQFVVQPYASTFLGGVRVAMADMNGDGLSDIITVPGAGQVARIHVFDGVDGAPLAGPLNGKKPLGKRYKGGAFVAAGDVNGDGFIDVVVGGKSNWKAYSGKNGQLLASVQPFGKKYRGGVTVAVADVTGDGAEAEIVAGRLKGKPQVKVYKGTGSTPLTKWTAAAPGGVFVSAGDLDGDGIAEVVVGQASGGSQVQAYDGSTGNLLNQFTAFDPSFTGGVRLALRDADGDDKADIVAVQGRPGESLVKVIDGETLAELDSFFAIDPPVTGNFFVG